MRHAAHGLEIAQQGKTNAGQPRPCGFEIAPQGDDFDDIRAEYTAILQKQLASGNNGIVKTKYLTFTIEADNLKTARARLTRIGLDLLGYFKTCLLYTSRCV